jgi:ankyrin repeat protein
MDTPNRRHLLRTFACALALLAADASAQLAPADSDLVAAIMSDNAAQANAAIAKGANVNADTGEGRTPLIVAAMSIRPAMVRLLLEHGADPNRRASDAATGNALTAAFFAMNGTELTGRGDEPDARKHAAALDVLKAVAGSKVDLNAKVRRAATELTALMIAADAGAQDAVEVLLAAGADPNAANGGRYTALDYAVDRAPSWSPASPAARTAIVSALLAAGAKRDHKAADGVSVLDRAKRGGNAATIALLSKP